jgi:hypothetical protein
MASAEIQQTSVGVQFLVELIPRAIDHRHQVAVASPHASQRKVQHQQAEYRIAGLRRRELQGRQQLTGSLFF